MFFRRLFGAVFLFLVLGGFFGLVNNNRSSDAYTQGYIAGQQSVATTEDGTETAVSPAPHPYQPHRTGFSFFGGLFKLFTFFFGFMLLMSFMGMIFGCKRRHRKGGWHHARHWGNWQKHSEKPPWYDFDDSDEPIMKA